MRISPNARNQQIHFLMQNDDGTAATGLTIADMDLTYVRDGALPIKVTLAALQAANSAHSDNHAIEVDAENIVPPADYRVDVVDAAFVEGVARVQLILTCVGCKASVIEVELTAGAADDISAETGAASETVLTDILNAVSDYLGLGFTCPANTTPDGLLVRRAVVQWLREFYAPPPVSLPGIPVYVHKWSFLRPVTSIVAWVDAAGTIDSVDDVENDDGLILIADAVTFYPSMVGKSLVVTDGGTYTIVSYLSSTQVVVDATPEADIGKDFAVSANGDYRLPTDFGWMESTLSFEPGVYSGSIQRCSEAVIRQQRTGGLGSGYPAWAAVKPRTPDLTSTAGHPGHDLLLWPAPCVELTLSYRYGIAADTLADLSRAAPLGADMHGTAIRAACMAVAEREVNNGGNGLKMAEYRSRLMSAIQLDLEVSTPAVFAGARDMGRVSRPLGTLEYVGTP